MTGWTEKPEIATVSETIAVLGGRGISAELVPDRASALDAVVRKIPEGSEVVTGASKSLEEIGFIDLLKSGSHGWVNLKEKILSEKDHTRLMELARWATATQFFLGSVQAVARTGEVVVASATGMQAAAYAFSAGNVIWVVGTQKIVPNLEDAMRRVREHCLPLEDARIKSEGFPGSYLGKLLVVERERPGRISVVFVNESLGF